jgi:uncharacterized protein YggE
MTARAMCAALLFAAFAVTGFAQGPGDPPRPPVRAIRATGEAVVTATPDRAEMNVAVTTQAATAEQAAAENARKTEAVLAAVRKALEPGAEVKTVGYTLAPNYVYPREGGEAKVTGYNASNTVLVTTNDLKRVGAVIDAAVGAGANNIQGLQFTLKNDATVQAEALRQAAQNARRRAEAIAAGLGVKPNGIVQAEEASAGVRPVMYEASAIRTASAQTPVEPGTVEVRATVTVAIGFLE